MNARQQHNRDFMNQIIREVYVKNIRNLIIFYNYNKNTDIFDDSARFVWDSKLPDALESLFDACGLMIDEFQVYVSTDRIEITLKKEDE